MNPQTALTKYVGKIGPLRESLREKAEGILDQFLKNAADAAAAGDFETAQKSLQWLLEHMPADDDGTKLIDVSVDKAAKAALSKDQRNGPRIQIGLAVGPMAGALPEHSNVEVIEIPTDQPGPRGNRRQR